MTERHALPKRNANVQSVDCFRASLMNSLLAYHCKLTFVYACSNYYMFVFFPYWMYCHVRCHYPLSIRHCKWPDGPFVIKDDLIWFDLKSKDVQQNSYNASNHADKKVD